MSLMLCPRLYPVSARLLERPGSTPEPLENNLMLITQLQNYTCGLFFFLICTGLFACSFFFGLQILVGFSWYLEYQYWKKDYSHALSFCSHLHFLRSRYQEQYNCCLVLSLCNSTLDNVTTCPTLVGILF